MLHELRIENLLLIERAELRFERGLNVVTGETGAGKTILAHSLDLLLGGRARPQIVRPGASEAYVEGAFEIPAGLLDDPELADLAERLPSDASEIVLGRRVGASGRTSAFVGGRAASAADLRLLGGRLVAFYGQHEHRKLALGAAQLEVLDGFAGQAHLERLRDYRGAHAEVQRLGRELDELRDREGARERELDVHRFELAEIEAADPRPSEAEELRVERERLRYSERLGAAATAALAAIGGDAVEDPSHRPADSLVADASAELGAVAGIDPALDQTAGRLDSLGFELADVASTLRSALEAIDAEPGRLETVEDRLATLERLERKHGGSAESVLAQADWLRAEIERLENAEGHAAELEAKLSQASELRAGLAAKLTATRRKAAGRLEKQVAAELSDLAMEGASLEARLVPEDDGFGRRGAERVELLLSTNPGLPASPLRDAASGGELSRVMLALSTVAGPGGESAARCLVFDEIDAGIGGHAARAVGERLRALGAERQVLGITHLPQVASLASTHFVVAKDTAGASARATVERVTDDAVVDELCRMLGAEPGDEAASRHARELLLAAA